MLLLAKAKSMQDVAKTKTKEGNTKVLDANSLRTQLLALPAGKMQLDYYSNTEERQFNARWRSTPD